MTRINSLNEVDVTWNTSTCSPSSDGMVFTFWLETSESAAKRGGFSPDRLVATLRADPSIDPLLIINPFRSAPRQIIKRAIGRTQATAAATPKETVISPMRLRHQEATGPMALRWAYTRYDKKVQKAVERSGLKHPPIIITNPFYAAYAPLSWAGPITYYGWDDWAALPAVEHWWPDYLNAYSLIRKRRHRVCTVSQALLNRIDPIGPGVVIPNGVAPTEWTGSWTSPEWLASLPTPLIVYAGAIHVRLNVEDIREISAAFPAATILVIGPTSSPEVVTELTGIKNVIVRGPLPRNQISGVIRSADVCIMPHHINDLTRSMSPLKIYEYCAAGRPSVATDLPPVRGIHERVHLVPRGGSFAMAVRRALLDGPMSEIDRLAFIEANSWAKRHSRLIAFARLQSNGDDRSAPC